MKIISKITLFIIVLVSFGVLNAWIINGPLLEHNSQMSMNQFQGVQQTDVIPGFGVTFNTIYIAEVVFLAVLGALLFLKHITDLLPKEKI